MKVAIFENEYSHFKTSFDGFNLIYFSNRLNIEDFTSSQAFGDLSRLNNYDVLIVDIDLSIVSKMDGYQLINEVIRLGIQNPKIMILTGHISMSEKLKAKGLPDYPIISKPLTLDAIKKAFQHYQLL
jgi:CheY-like chemotaxis protein